LRFILDLLLSYGHGLNVNVNLFHRVLNEHIVRCAPLGYASEVAWALWCSIMLSVKLDRVTATAISTLPDSFVALLALDARQRGLVPRGLTTSIWEPFMTREGLRGEQWLLSYESFIKGWLPSADPGSDHIRRDAAFNYLRDFKVSFYDAKRTAPTVSAIAGPEPGSPYLDLP